MSTDDSPEKLHEDGTVETPEWHRARAKRLPRNGFTKMAEQHEQARAGNRAPTAAGADEIAPAGCTVCPRPLRPGGRRDLWLASSCGALSMGPRLRHFLTGPTRPSPACARSMGRHDKRRATLCRFRPR